MSSKRSSGVDRASYRQSLGLFATVRKQVITSEQSRAVASGTPADLAWIHALTDKQISAVADEVLSMATDDMSIEHIEEIVVEHLRSKYGPNVA